MKWFLLNLIFVSSLASANASNPDAMDLTYSPNCIAEAVSTKLNIILDKNKPLPKLFPASRTDRKTYEEAAKELYPGIETTGYLNFYTEDRNAIFLNDVRPAVGTFGRTPDDVLAHEFVHYLQSVYRHFSKEESASDAAEEPAVYYQGWFRDTYMTPAVHPTPCPQTQKQGHEFSKEWIFN